VGSSKLKGNWPEYFFTVSFLEALDKEFIKRAVSGSPMESLGLFRDFLFTGNGKIYRDTETINIGESPLLKRLLGDASNSQYGPYIHDTADSKKSSCIEENGYAQFDSSFTEGLREVEILDLNKKLNKPIFNLELIQKRWPKISGKKHPRIIPAQKHDWESFLRHYIVPCKNVLIMDPYVMSKKKSVDENIIPIIEAILTIQSVPPSIVIISTKSGFPDTEAIVRNRFSSKVEIDFVLEESIKAIPYHDRWIMTDQMVLNMPSGLDIVDSGTTHRSKLTNQALRSIYSGDDGQVQEVRDMWQSMRTFIEKRHSMRRVAPT
jgi:hypothetical protein